MSRLSEEEIQAIMEEYKDAPMVNPDKIYPPLPPAENVTPLVRIPEPISLTEKIGGTEYTVNAHFRKDGRDLLCSLRIYFDVAHTVMDFMTGRIGVMMTENNRQRKNYRLSVEFKGRCGMLYLHFTIPCLLSERKAL